MKRCTGAEWQLNIYLFIFALRKQDPTRTKHTDYTLAQSSSGQNPVTAGERLLRAHALHEQIIR